ncbi:helix-turn-helix transcriptional regulator [Pseudonocardia hispaniensis]|uniref:Helix-turn-helix transcriptional regulator n=1 Tax=Pseudonocardia hispaniensis TaxID=904933 RepID=A0ABW1J7T8_9PSEU
MQRLRVPLDSIEVDGATLKSLRIAADLSQEALAERAMISAYWYRQIEKNGQQPSLPVAQDLAAALGCRLSDFTVPTEAAA